MTVTASPVVQVLGAAVEGAMVDALDEVAVFDGIDAQQGYAFRSVTIGGTWDPDVDQLTTQDAVLVETTESGAGRLLTETTSVSCIAYSGGEGLTLAEHRDRVNDILAAIRAAVRAITAVDGASARAQMGAQQWAQVKDTQGAGVMAMFSVAVAVLP